MVLETVLLSAWGRLLILQDPDQTASPNLPYHAPCALQMAAPPKSSHELSYFFTFVYCDMDMHVYTYMGSICIHVRVPVEAPWSCLKSSWITLSWSPMRQALSNKPRAHQDVWSCSPAHSEDAALAFVSQNYR